MPAVAVCLDLLPLVDVVGEQTLGRSGTGPAISGRGALITAPTVDPGIYTDIAGNFYRRSESRIPCKSPLCTDRTEIAVI